MLFYCLNCHQPIHRILSTSTLLNCKHCQLVHVVDNNNLKSFYQNKEYNVNYKSTEPIKPGDNIVIDNQNYLLLNRSIWVGNYWQRHHLRNKGIYVHYLNEYVKTEIFELINSNGEKIWIEKKYDNLYLVKEYNASYKNFASLEIRYAGVGILKKTYNYVTMKNFDSDKTIVAFQDGTFHFHYFEGEATRRWTNNYYVRFSIYENNNSLFCIANQDGKEDISTSVAYCKFLMKRISNKSYKTKSLLARFFSSVN